MDHEFQIPLTELDAGGRDYAFAIGPAWLHAALEGTEASPGKSAGEVSVRLSKSGNDVAVHGKLHVEVTVHCARCTKPFLLPMEVPLAVLMVPAATARTPTGEEDLTPQDADVIPYEGDHVVLDDLVRDEILLAVPMIPLCSEDCPGIHPAPTEEPAPERIDPRLAPLLALKAQAGDTPPHPGEQATKKRKKE